jgi:peroxin-11B
MYLLVDHYVWATKIGLTDANPKQLSRIASRFWLVALVCNLMRNIYDILNIIQNNRRGLRKGQQESVSISRYSEEEYCSRATSRSALGAVLANKPVIIDTIKNAADLLLPLTNLGFVNTPVQVQGILGMISSVMGILSVWNANLKLKP